MMVNIHEAKTTFSKLIKQVQEGKKVVISKSGTPIVEIIPIQQKKTKRKPGALKGKIAIKADFDAPLPEDYLKDFEE